MREKREEIAANLRKIDGMGQGGRGVGQMWIDASRERDDAHKKVNVLEEEAIVARNEIESLSWQIIVLKGVIAHLQSSGKS